MPDMHFVRPTTVSFKFAARTILELGKELISSDEVALSRTDQERGRRQVTPCRDRCEHPASSRSHYREAVARITEEESDVQFGKS